MIDVEMTLLCAGVVEWINMAVINHPVRLLAKKKSDKEFKNERGNYEFVKKNVKLASTNPRH